MCAEENCSSVDSWLLCDEDISGMFEPDALSQELTGMVCIDVDCIDVDCTDVDCADVDCADVDCADLLKYCCYPHDGGVLD